MQVRGTRGIYSYSAKGIPNTRGAVDGTAGLPRPSFTAARRRIVERRAVDVAVADWLVAAHLSQEDASKAVDVVFLVFFVVANSFVPVEMEFSMIFRAENILCKNSRKCFD